MYQFIVITTPILNPNLCSWAQIKAKMLDNNSTDIIFKKNRLKTGLD